MTVDKNLIGRCGLYWGICEIYRAYKDSKELQLKLAERHRCRPEEVRCEGCQALELSGWSYEKEWGKNCKILKCLNTNGLSFCFDCGEYDTCPKHSKFTKICSGLGMDLRENLRTIQEGKVEEWLSGQHQKWRCLECGRPIIVSYDFDECHWCGTKIAVRKP